MALLFLLLLPACTPPPTPSLEINAEGARVSNVSARTLRELRTEPPNMEQWAEIFPVYVGELPNEGDDRSPMLGTWTVGDDTIRFTPRFPFVPGRTYTASFVDPGSGRRLEASIRLPTPDVEPATEVVAVRPSLDVFPENILRLYLHFSGPMTRGHARRHVRLFNAEGEEVPEPFVAPEHELWDGAATRLTLHFDPGRIKRQVGPNLELGPPLVAGNTYRLVVDRDWPDARGAPLLDGFETTLRIGPPDRTPPNPDAWTLDSPGGPDAPVTLWFPESLDPALLERLVTVHDAADDRLAGDVRVDPAGRSWSFRPETPWKAGDYEIRVDPALEDPAGNSLRRAFETPLDAPETNEPVRLPFAVTTPG